MKQYEIRLAKPEDTQKVKAFNQRLEAAGETHHRLSIDLPFRTMAHKVNSPIKVEKFFCTDGEEIRAGIGIKRMMFKLNGSYKEVAVWSKPLSEGIINPDFRGTGRLIIDEMLRRYPLIYATGAPHAGSARVMNRAKWFSLPVPFHFMVLKPAPFLRNINYLYKNKWMEFILRTSARSGIGNAGFTLVKMVQSLCGRFPRVSNVSIEPFDKWGDWADKVWERSKDDYSLIGDRSYLALDSLYPQGNEQLLKICFKAADTKSVLGWAVITLAKLKNSKYFGNMTLAAIVDMLATSENVDSVVSGAVVAARKADADLLVVNHTDCRWNTAFKRAGMLPWKTNHYLWLSSGLKKEYKPINKDVTNRFYFTRGDGHGPTSLWMADY